MLFFLLQTLIDQCPFSLQQSRLGIYRIMIESPPNCFVPLVAKRSMAS